SDGGAGAVRDRDVHHGRRVLVEEASLAELDRLAEAHAELVRLAEAAEEVAAQARHEDKEDRGDGARREHAAQEEGDEPALGMGAGGGAGTGSDGGNARAYPRGGGALKKHFSEAQLPEHRRREGARDETD